MSESLTKSFISQGAIVISIAVSSIIGFNYVGDRTDRAIEKAFESKCQPLIEDNIMLKAYAKENRALIISNALDIDHTMLSVNIFIDWYNRTYHKDFLRPVDVEEQTAKKRK